VTGMTRRQPQIDANGYFISPRIATRQLSSRCQHVRSVCISTVLGTNSLNSADVQLSIKQTGHTCHVDVIAPTNDIYWTLEVL